MYASHSFLGKLRQAYCYSLCDAVLDEEFGLTGVRSVKIKVKRVAVGEVKRRSDKATGDQAFRRNSRRGNHRAL